LPKENEPKEKAASHLSARGGYPALFKITGRCETRPPTSDSNSPRAVPVIFTLLGYVKWHLKD